MSNNYDLQKPCDACPFLKTAKHGLHKSRLAEIIESNGVFPCHKTLLYDDSGESIELPTSQACAGYLIFMEKIGASSQMMRIAERLNLYVPEKLMSNDEVTDLVCDTFRELVKVHRS